MKIFICTLLLLVALLSPNLSNAQTTYATSQIVLPNNPLLDLNINQSFVSGEEINWYKIPVYKDSIDLQLILTLDSFVFKAYKIEVFSGICSNLTLLKADSIRNATDSILNIALNNLSANDSLYLKVTSVNNNGCNLCIIRARLLDF